MHRIGDRVELHFDIFSRHQFIPVIRMGMGGQGGHDFGGVARVPAFGRRREHADRAEVFRA